MIYVSRFNQDYFLYFSTITSSISPNYVPLIIDALSAQATLFLIIMSKSIFQSIQRQNSIIEVKNARSDKKLPFHISFFASYLKSL